MIYDPQWMMITHVVPGEDGYPQERASLGEVLPRTQANDVGVGDRNFCPTDFLFGIARRQSSFVIRQHGQHLHWCLVGKRHYSGRSATGKGYEQAVELRDEEGAILTARRVTVELDKPTRDGGTELHILTNIPKGGADALAIADLYRGRWASEIALGELAATVAGGINPLGYPKASLFCFCVALVAYNVPSVIKGALRAAPGEAKVTKEVSGYYMANEISRTYDGMMIAIPEAHGHRFAKMTAGELGRVLGELAQRVRWARLQKHPRGPKKPVVQKPKNKKPPHVSTARLLEKRKKTG